MPSRTRSVFRRSRAVEAIDMDNTEESAWKRKYRQSLNDIDLATQFAGYMSADVSKSFLDHNKAEFETILEKRPRRFSTSPIDTIEEEPTWQDLDISTTKPRHSRHWSLEPPAQAHLAPVTSKDSSSKRQRLLRPMKSFVNFVRRT